MRYYTKFFSSVLSISFASQVVCAQIDTNDRLAPTSGECLLGTYSYVKLKHREHRGLGYNTGYSTLELFLTPSWDSRVQPIVDAKGHVFNNGDLAANVGLAGRVADQNENFAFGLAAYYDFRKFKNLKTSQASIGVEFLSHYVDFRMNGYLPVSGYATEVVDRGAAFGGFSGNNVMLNSIARFSFPSADAEIGGLIPTGLDYITFYLATGPYYLFKQNAKTIADGNAFGWRASAELNITDWIDLGAEYTHDRIFNSRIVGYLSFNIPLGRRASKNKSKCHSFAKNMRMKTQKVRRNEIIPMNRKNTKIPLAGLNVIFVDNTGTIGSGTSPSNGLGTYESPYTNLAVVQSQTNPNDFIYIYPGDGTTKGYDTGLALKTGQIFHSASIPTTFDGVLIPAQATSRPIITNTGGAGITLADNTQVIGIQVFEPSSHAIEGTDVGNFTINSCKLTAASNMSGIYLDMINNGFFVSNNAFFGANANNNQAIYLGAVTGKSGLMEIRNNRLNSIFDFALTYDVKTDSSEVGLDLNFSNNTITNATANGINIVRLPGISNLTFDNNTLTTLDDVNITNINTMNVDTNIDFRNNTFQGGTIAFQIYSTLGDAYTISLTDNTATFAGNNVVLPFLVQLENTGDSRVIMSRNSFTEQGNDPGTPAVQVRYKIATGDTNDGTNTLEYKNNDIVSVTSSIDDFKLQITGDIENIKAEIYDNTSTTLDEGFIVIQDNIGPAVCFDFQRNSAFQMGITVPAGNDFSIISEDGTEAGFKALNPDISTFNLSPNLDSSNYVKSCSQ